MKTSFYLYTFPCSLFFFFFSLQAIAQNSTGSLGLSKGMIIETEITSYKTPLLEDAVKWIKMKPNKKAETVMLFNADISAGKIAPTSKTILPTKIEESTIGNVTSIYTGTTKIGSTDYHLTITDKVDSVHYMLNNAMPFAIVGKNNDTTGVWCYGVRTYPKHIDVGTYIPGYINEMNLFPTDLKTSRREFFNFSGGNGYSYSGFIQVRKTRTMQVNSIFINTPFYVVGKEDVEVSGKVYTAYKLINEQLSKSSINTIVKEDPNDFFNNKTLSDKIKTYLEERGRGWDTPEKKAEILAKMQSQTGMNTNEQGYLVNMQESWYVPDLGLIVKSRYFDGTGALQMESKIVSIK